MTATNTETGHVLNKLRSEARHLDARIAEFEEKRTSLLNELTKCDDDLAYFQQAREEVAEVLETGSFPI